MTRLKVLANQQGNIIASFLVDDALARTGSADDAPQATFLPQEGHGVHEVEVPADLLASKEPIFQALGKYRLDTAPEPRLVLKDQKAP